MYLFFLLKRGWSESFLSFSHPIFIFISALLCKIYWKKAQMMVVLVQNGFFVGAIHHMQRTAFLSLFAHHNCSTNSHSHPHKQEKSKMCHNKLAHNIISIQHDTLGPSSLNQGSNNCFYQKTEPLEYSPFCYVSHKYGN